MIILTPESSLLNVIPADLLKKYPTININHHVICINDTDILTSDIEKNNISFGKF